MNQPPLEVADLVRTAGEAFIERNRQWLRWKHVKVLRAIAASRTAVLGGHVDHLTSSVCALARHTSSNSHFVRIASHRIFI
jgi:hypothetical protein